MLIMNQEGDAILNIEEITEITIAQVEGDGLADIEAGEKSEQGMWVINAIEGGFGFRLGIYETEEKAMRILRNIMDVYKCSDMSKVAYIDLQEEE